MAAAAAVSAAFACEAKGEEVKDGWEPGGKWGLVHM